MTVFMLVFSVFPVLVLSVFLATFVPSVLFLPFLGLLQPLQLVLSSLLHALPLAILLQIFRIHIVRLVSFQRLRVRRRNETVGRRSDSGDRVISVQGSAWLTVAWRTFVIRRQRGLPSTFAQWQQWIWIVFCNLIEEFSTRKYSRFTKNSQD